MKYYVSQTLDIILTVVFDNPALILSEATSVAIYYRSPKGVQGSWAATVNGGTLVYTVPYGIINKAGDWAVWTYVAFNDNIYIGTPSIINAYTPGT